MIGGVAQWVARLTRNVEVVGSIPIKGPHCFLEQETLPLLLSTGYFQERIQAPSLNIVKNIKLKLENDTMIFMVSVVRFSEIKTRV